MKNCLKRYKIRYLKQGKSQLLGLNFLRWTLCGRETGHSLETLLSFPRFCEEILKSLRSGFELDSFSNAIKKLTEKFGLDYLLVDTHPGLEDDTLLAMGVCNNLLVVSRLDQQDMFGTGVLAEVARTLEKPVHLVLNMIPSAMSTSEASRVINKIGANFKVQVLGWLPFSEEITNSLSKSVFILDNPRHPITKRFNELATKLEGLSGVN